MPTKGIQDTNNPLCCTTKRIRVIGTWWNQANWEEWKEGIQFICKRKDSTNLSLWKGSVCWIRKVVLTDSCRNRSIFTSKESVFFTHDSLQFIELSDHTRQEVKFVDFSCTSDGCRFFSSQTSLLSQWRCNNTSTRHVFWKRTNFFMEGHVGQFSNEVFNLKFLVFTPEEFTIFKTCHQDFFISSDNIFQVLSVTITDWDEVWFKFTIKVTYNKVPLVRFHWCHQDFFWNVQIFSIKASHEGSWVFDQVQDFIQKSFFDLNLNTLSCFDGFDLLTNHVFTFFAIRNHVNGTKVFFIRIRISNFHFMSKETVSTTHTTWLDIQEIKVERFVAQKNCQGVNWANVFKGVVGPVHADREGQRSKHFWNASQNFFSWFSSFVLRDINVLFTLDFTKFDIVNRQAFSTDESLRCFWEVSICIQGDFLRRSFKIFGQIRLLIS